MSTWRSSNLQGVCCLERVRWDVNSPETLLGGVFVTSPSWTTGRSPTVTQSDRHCMTLRTHVMEADLRLKWLPRNSSRSSPILMLRVCRLRFPCQVISWDLPRYIIFISVKAKQVIEDLSIIDALVEQHDVVYLLTDSREARWLPTVLANKHKKVSLIYKSILDMLCRRPWIRLIHHNQTRNVSVVSRPTNPWR